MKVAHPGLLLHSQRDQGTAKLPLRSATCPSASHRTLGSTGRVVRHWNRLTWEMVESPIPGSVPKMHRCNTWGHGLVVALAVLAEWLDLVILEGFSSLSESMSSLPGPKE